MRAHNGWQTLIGAVLLAAVLGSGSAQAGQTCEARRPTVESMARDLALAASVAAELDALAANEGAEVVLLARAGQDLREYGLRWSHLGIAYRDRAALAGRGAWRVVHKLNQCGSDRSALYRQGLAEFFADGLFAHEAGVVALAPPLAARVAAQLQDNRLLAQLHEPRYNMLAYPWSGPYQQSNQWAIETLALLADPAVRSRAAARAWLRRHDYRPDTIRLSAVKRLGARIGSAHIAFDDHPFDRRMAGRIDTVTADSVFAWAPRAGIGGAPRVLRPRPSGGGPGDGFGRGLRHVEVDLLQRAGAAVLVEIDAAAPDLAAGVVVGVLQRERGPRAVQVQRADAGLLERLQRAVREPDAERGEGRIGVVEPAVAVAVELPQIIEAVA
ncbi:DUF2145 domain-containing protein [Azospira restricta]|uniref:DUF2145 domain-containing protein n=1 Tax=Azospira restricta TaxID=404405 RepID=A0A974SQ11_9RHOO|nr:DUF2145 domain-containing protein [Azospira restricta]QRJ64396.1 DUF2145 domain-containing protein [Azospira restricta]